MKASRHLCTVSLSGELGGDVASCLSRTTKTSHVRRNRAPATATRHAPREKVMPTRRQRLSVWGTGGREFKSPRSYQCFQQVSSGTTYEQSAVLHFYRPCFTLRCSLSVLAGAPRGSLDCPL